MEKPDVQALAEKMISAVRGFVAKAKAEVEASFGERIAGLESKIAAIPAGPKGEKGEPGEPIRGKDGVDGAKGERGEPGPGVDPLVVKAMVGAEVALAVAAFPKPADGRDGAPGAKGDTGPAGKDATAEQVKPLVVQEVERVVSALPKPKDGKDGAPGAAGEPGVAGPRGEAGPPGESVKGDPGKDGRDGNDGASIHPDTVALMVAQQVSKAIEALPKTVDGRDGRDAAQLDILPSIDEEKSYRRGTWASHNGGLILAARQTDAVKDGAIVEAGWVVMVEGIAAVVVTQGEDPRALEVAAMLTSGTKAVAGFRMPVMIYREVWREGEYERGDVVTWTGSAWHCQQKTTGKPGESDDWKMIVKKGAAGRDWNDPKAQAPREPVRLR